MREPDEQEHLEEKRLLQLWSEQGRSRFSPGSCEGLYLVALKLSGQASPAEVRAADEHLQHCDDCRAAHDSSRRPAGPGRFTPRPAVAWPRRSAWLPSVMAVAASLLILAGALWLHGGPHDSPDAPPERFEQPGGPPADGIQGMGHPVASGDRLGLYLWTPEGLTPLEPGAQVSPGAVLNMDYSTEQGGYLAIFRVTEPDPVRAVFPEDGDRGPRLLRARQKPLELLEHVPEGSGCLWYVAVFSEYSLPLTRLATTLQEQARTTARSSSNPCERSFVIEEARSTWTFPVRR